MIITPDDHSIKCGREGLFFPSRLCVLELVRNFLFQAMKVSVGCPQSDRCTVQKPLSLRCDDGRYHRLRDHRRGHLSG
jgi:hypothetical protein